MSVVVLFGLRMLNMVSRVLSSGNSVLLVCRCCRKAVRLSSDIGVIFHWVGNHFLIDVVLFVEGSRSVYILYSEVYVVDSAV